MGQWGYTPQNTMVYLGLPFAYQTWPWTKNYDWRFLMGKSSIKEGFFHCRVWLPSAEGNSKNEKSVIPNMPHWLLGPEVKGLFKILTREKYLQIQNRIHAKATPGVKIMRMLVFIRNVSWWQEPHASKDLSSVSHNYILYMYTNSLHIVYLHTSMHIYIYIPT